MTMFTFMRPNRTLSKTAIHKKKPVMLKDIRKSTPTTKKKRPKMYTQKSDRDMMLQIMETYGVEFSELAAQSRVLAETWEKWLVNGAMPYGRGRWLLGYLSAVSVYWGISTRG